MASRKWMELEAERAKLNQDFTAKAAALGDQMRELHNDWDVKLCEVDDKIDDARCSKCWQEGWIDAVNGDQDASHWCDCEHGIEAKEAADEANLNAALEAREVV